MQKILVTGSDGQLGRSLKNALREKDNLEMLYTDIDTLDITDIDSLDKFVTDGNVGTIVNCAAYTAVEKAETEEVAAAKINAEAVANIGKTARKHHLKVLHISTDYVFSGETFKPYCENDTPNPKSVYGRTKLEGERLLSSFCQDAIIVRTSWLYSEYGHNFVKTIISKAGMTDTLDVVFDQIGSPTYAGDLAEAIGKILSCEEWKPGVYHFSNEGIASWYDFAVSILRNIGNTNCKVNPVATQDYPTAAKRPPYSAMNKNKIKKTFGLNIPHWEQSLAKCIKNLNDNV